MPQIASLSGFGFKVKIQQKRQSFYVVLAKEIILGNLIKKGDDMYYYLSYIDGRKAIIALLDSKPLEAPNQIIIDKQIGLHPPKRVLKATPPL